LYPVITTRSNVAKTVIVFSIILKNITNNYRLKTS